MLQEWRGSEKKVLLEIHFCDFSHEGQVNNCKECGEEFAIQSAVDEYL